DGRTDVSFTVAAGDLAETLLAAEVAANDVGARGVTYDANVAKLSVVGQGMKTHTGVANALFNVLADARINIQMITTSEIKISVLLDRASAAQALTQVHRTFELERPVQDLPGPFRPRKLTHRGRAAEDQNGDTHPAIKQAGGMEDLVISGVELDERQARITL